MDERKYASANGTRLAMSGWDFTNILKSGSAQILQQAEVYVIDNKESNCSLSGTPYPLQFCAGRYENDEGSFLM